jgi:hypothetical protein
MRKPAGWHRLTSPHEIYRVGQPPLLVAYGRLAVEHALAVARRAAVAAELPMVVGIVRTTAPRQWCLGLAQTDGTLTWIGRHPLLTAAEAQVHEVAAIMRQYPRADPAAVASLVAALTASGDTTS